jgi:DnaJ like chaperone protein
VDQGRVRGVFVGALFASLGHVLKADGRVTEAEIAQAENFIRSLGLDTEERRQAIARFNAGKDRGFDLEGALEEFVRISVGRGDLRQMFLEILLEGAATDGQITPAEQEILARVARKLHIPQLVFVAMINAYRATHAGGAYSGPRTSASSLSQAYASLGLEDSASDAEVKRAYRKLIRQYHPDRLISQGLPDEVMDRARNRVLEVNAAYDRIKAARGFK